MSKEYVNQTTTTPSKAGPKEWWGLAVIALPCILYAMDFTVLQLAVPHLINDLGPTNTELLWIIDIYGFVLAGALITMGVLGDRIGRRKLLLIGAFLFGIASIAAAFSTSSTGLIITRAILGLAAATLAPSTLSMIRNMFHDSKQRGIAISVWITSFSLGTAIGPLVGGAMLMHFWWGSVFLLAVPVMILLLLIGPKLLPEFKDTSSGKPDAFSAFLSLAAILPIVYALKSIAMHGIDVISGIAIFLGALFTYMFIRRQQTLPHPFIDLKLFRSRTFSLLLLVYLSIFFIVFSSFYFISQYLQLVREMTALEAGLWTLPWALSFVIGSMLAPLISQRFSPYRVLAGGLLLSTIGLLLLIALGTQTSLALYVVGFSLAALGFGPAMSLITDAIIASVPAKRAGMASGISETTSELGGALGIALLGSMAAFIYTAVLDPSLPGDSLGSTLQLLAESNSATPLAASMASAAFVQSLQWIFGLSALLSFGAFIAIAILEKKTVKTKY